MHALMLLVPAASVDAVCEFLSDDLDALSASVEDADAGTEAEQPVFDEPGVTSTATWKRARVDALFEDEPAATRAAAALIAAGPETGARVLSIAAVADRDWVRLTQAQFGPCEVTPTFWIVPTWSQVPAGATTVIRLDPGRAFGTGTHPTTRMCLRWIAAADGGWARVLDYGCGSGVLAIAAAKFGAGHIDAVDIDPAAVEATESNARANDAAVRCAAPDDAVGPYDLVVANILAAPLTLLAPLLSHRLAGGGRLVLSGILARQADELCAAYRPWLDLDVWAEDDGWALMTGTLHAGRAA
ncbi:MAG: 50S ribosomal protein L11 methyltransferase [Caldimonas sp.]